MKLIILHLIVFCLHQFNYKDQHISYEKLLHLYKSIKIKNYYY